MKRRDFVAGLGAGAAVAALAGCGQQKNASTGGADFGEGEVFEWKMVTTWPANFPGLGTGAESLARIIERASGGRIRIRVYGAGELVPALEVFDAVSTGTAQMGHGAAYYWKGKAEATQFFAATPFGMNAQERNAWMYYGGGLELWRDVYAPFGLVPHPAGNTGIQMGGWFNREINRLADLGGLKMRIPGLGGEVLRRAGGTPVNLPGGEIFTALKTGSIDATEWVGPYNDLAFGLYQAAKYYYYPGWHEPGSTMEAIFNKDALDALPDDLRQLVFTACRAVNDDMLAEFTARNNEALAVLVEDHGVELRRFPDEVLRRLYGLSMDVIAELAGADPMVERVWASQQAFLNQARAWHDVSEFAYFRARELSD
jgi:TRAP-type mannitol/chloroaromatic compound transport system substrate-binding protein